MDSQEMLSSETDENKDPNLLPVRYVKIDVPLDRVKSDLLDMMDDPDDCMLQMSNVVDSKIEKSSHHNLMKIKHKNSLGKNSLAEKIQKPRKKVKFSNIMLPYTKYDVKLYNTYLSQVAWIISLEKVVWMKDKISGLQLKLWISLKTLGHYVWTP